MSSNKKNKNDTFEKFKARYTLAENKRRIKLKVLRTGNALMSSWSVKDVYFWKLGFPRVLGRSYEHTQTYGC